MGQLYKPRIFSGWFNSMNSSKAVMRRRALLHQFSSPYLCIVLLVLLGLLILIHWSVRDQLHELQSYNEGRVADTGRTLEMVGKYKSEIDSLKEKLRQKCDHGDNHISNKVIPLPPSDLNSNDVVITNVNLDSLLNGPIPCAEPCAQHPVLVDHILSVMDKPSGTRPVLKDEEGIKNQRGQTGQVDLILKYFNNKKKGFFIEAGAWDGEDLSNTIYMETQMEWTGLLVEPNIGVYKKLKGKKRNTHSINSCLSIKGYAEKVKFDTADVFGAIEDEENPNKDELLDLRNRYQNQFRHKDVARETILVQCFPLYSLLLAIGNPRVDFMSLDIEGSELAVLRTIPFDKVHIELFLIETQHSNETAITELMTKNGYEMQPMPPFDHIYFKK